MMRWMAPWRQGDIASRYTSGTIHHLLGLCTIVFCIVTGRSATDWLLTVLDICLVIRCCSGRVKTGNQIAMDFSQVWAHTGGVGTKLKTWIGYDEPSASFMCLCIYVYINVHMYLKMFVYIICIHAIMYIYMCVCLHIYIYWIHTYSAYIYICVCMYTSIYIHRRKCIYRYMCLCTCTFLHASISTNVCMCI